MNWRHPLYFHLLWLLVALVVWFLYRPRLRRHELVPCLDLWIEQAVADAWWQSWRQVMWLLFTFAVFFTAVVTALAGPEWRTTCRRTVVVLDNSASMGTLERQGSRFRQACGIVGQYQASGEMTLLVTAPGPHRVEPDALASIPVDSTGGMPEEAVQMALALADAREQVVIVSDGAGPVWRRLLSALAQTPRPPRLHTVGETAHNLCLSVPEAYRTADGQVMLGIEIDNCGSDRRQGELVWQYTPATDGAIEKQSIAFALAAGGQAYHRLSLAGRGGTWRATLPEDALSSDNLAVCAVPVFRQARVLVMSEKPEPHIFAALSAYPHLVDRHRSGWCSDAVLPDSAADYDLVLVCRPTLPSLGDRGNFLLWGTVVEDRPWHVAPRIQPGAVWGVNPDHPLARYVDVSALQVKQAWQAPQLPPESVILRAERGPLAWENSGAGVRAICVAFACRDANWQYLPSFPLFLHNVLLWATHQQTEARLKVTAAAAGEGDIAPFAGQYPAMPDRFGEGIPMFLRAHTIVLAFLLWLLLRRLCKNFAG